MRNRVEKLKGHVAILLNAYLGLREKYEVLKPIAFEKSVAKKHGAKRRARGFLVIRRSLFESCVLDVTCLAFDADSRTPSVIAFVKALKEKRVCEVLRNSQKRKAVFDKKIQRVFVEWEDFKSRPWASSFRKLRDQRISHLELKKVDGEYKRLDVASLGLKWGSIEEAVDLLEKIILDLMGVVCDEGYDLENMKLDLERDGKNFWK